MEQEGFRNMLFFELGASKASEFEQFKMRMRLLAF